MEQLHALAELTEAGLMFELESTAPEAVQSALGMASRRIGGGVALSMRDDPSGYWSKALGFGFDEPVTAELMARVCDFYRSEGSPGAVIQIAPSLLPPDWDDICAAQNISPGSYWVKLACEVDAFHPGATELRVGPAGPDLADEWASVMLRGFGMPEQGLAAMMAAFVGHPRFHPYAAWDGDEMIAAASLFIDQRVGAFFGASTLPTHRSRGAQSALLAIRARKAAEAGCRWLTAEAGKPTGDSVNPSLNNMKRAGFTTLYARQNWTWKPATAPSGS
jgi:hypothetical protein